MAWLGLPSRSLHSLLVGGGDGVGGCGVGSGAGFSPDNLKELRVNGNKITKLPDDLMGSAQLILIDVGNNILTSVGDFAVVKKLRYLCNLNLRGNKIAEDPACRVQAQEWVPKLRILDGQSTDANSAKVASKREAEAYDAARKAKKKKYLTKDESKEIKAHVGTVSFDDADGPAVVQMGMAADTGSDKRRPRPEAIKTKGKAALKPRPGGGGVGSGEAVAAAGKSKTTIKVKSKKKEGKAAAPEPAEKVADDPSAKKKLKLKKLAKAAKATEAVPAKQVAAAPEPAETVADDPSTKKKLKKKKKNKASAGAESTLEEAESAPASRSKLAKPKAAQMGGDAAQAKAAKATEAAPAKQAQRTADAIEARSQTAGASGMLSVQNAKRKRSGAKQALTPDALGGGLSDTLFGAAAIGQW